VRPRRTDVETIEARYTSESLFALMAYVWKREGSQRGGGTSGGGAGEEESAFYRGHPYAYYALAPRAAHTPPSTPASVPGHGLAIPAVLPPSPALPPRPPTPFCWPGDAACELKRLINI
jgi:hypothetical protein